MDLILIGYFPKRFTPQPEHLDVAGVTEICSVADCIAPSPDEWIDKWLHNEAFVYDSPEIARSVVPRNAADQFLIYGYRVLPTRYAPGGGEESAELPQIAAIALDSSFEFLGFDVVSRSISATFECSPLSCNYMAKEVQVNQYCLLFSVEEAMEFAKRCAREQPEPGAYYVVEVFRQRDNRAG